MLHNSSGLESVLGANQCNFRAARLTAQVGTLTLLNHCAEAAAAKARNRTWLDSCMFLLDADGEWELRLSLGAAKILDVV